MSLAYKLAVIVVFCAAVASAQSISTVAGGGTDDGRPATVASLFLPQAAAFDAKGNLYVADVYDNKIRRVSATSGLISTVAGNGVFSFSGDGGPATTAGLAAPLGLAFDSAGNLYVADTNNHRIRKIDGVSGTISTVAGNGIYGYSGDGGPATSAMLNGPYSLAFDSAGNLYIADYDNDRIRKLATNGIITTVAGNGTRGFAGDGGAATAAQLHRPVGVAFDASGNLYVADSGNYRVRKVAAVGGVISTVAGNGAGAFNGDGSSATAASLDPAGVVVSEAGDLYVADRGNCRVRKIIGGNGTISTVAGNGCGFRGDDGPAVLAGLTFPTGVSFDRSGNLFIVDRYNHRIRKVAASTGIISTFVGNGSAGFSGDGGPATAAGLTFPAGLALDSSGNLYVGDTYANKVRKITAHTRIISTIAGGGTTLGDGGPATAAGLNARDVTVDPAGNVYVTDSANRRIRKIDAQSGIITTVAGSNAATFSGDGGPATLAGLGTSEYGPAAAAVDASGNLYIADYGNHRIRKVTAQTGIISTVAGKGTKGFSGDGGPATAAELAFPIDVLVDGAGNLFVAELGNFRIRKVAAATGVITTIGGNGSFGLSGDGGPATAAGLAYPEAIGLDSHGNVFIADGNFVRKIDAVSGIITTVAGSNTDGSTGDGGPATAAGLAYPYGVAIDPNDNLYIAGSGRIRAVFACVTVSPTALQQPANGSSGVSTSPALSWKSVDGAFRYDVYLDTANPPVKVLAADVTTPAYAPANLEPLKTYYWKVVVKGDPFCTPFSMASSEVFSFTTRGSCTTPGSFTTSLSNPSSSTISWTAAPRAGTYDLFLGTSNPPRSYAKGSSATSVTVSGLAPGTSYFWYVVAHATCDSALTSETSVQSFTTGGSCGAAGSFNLDAPADNDGSVPSTATLTWSASPGAGSYDLYLGSGSNPSLYMSDLSQTAVDISRLSPGAAYSWRVVAKAACDVTKSVTSPVRHFRVASCGTPAAPQNVVAPQGQVSTGATYSVSWNEVLGIDDGGSYLVERATDSGFANIVDQQQTTAPAASFITDIAGTYYHRVRAIAGCDPARRSGPSSTVAVTLASGPPVVVFTVLPKAVMTKLGDRLEDRKTSCTLENLSAGPVQVLMGPQFTGPIRFFSVVDPFGGDGAVISLQPHVPKTLEIRFAGPRNDQAGAYEGSVYVSSLLQPLAYTPQAFVSLKVGGSDATAAPRILVSGAETGFAYFPPASGDDSARPAISVDLVNGGSSAMDVTAEIGPEAWLKMEKDWNATAVQANMFRTLRLFTQRTRAVAGAALPRYTYLTVRNKAGQPARLLVEDSGEAPASAGRGAPLGAADPSRVIPQITSATVLVFTNCGAAVVPLELIMTPEGADGFAESSIKRATIAIPPNDVVAITDPLSQIFGLNGGNAAFEVRGTAASLGQVAIRAELQQRVEGGGKVATVTPVVLRGEGARVGSPHRVAGIISDATTKTALVVTETSGRDETTAHVVLYDGAGARRGEQTIELGRYGMKRIDDVAQTLAGGAKIDSGRVDLDIPQGGGAVVATAIVSDRTSGANAAFVSRAIGAEVHLSALGRPATATTPALTYIVPDVVATSTVETMVGLSTASGATAKIAFRDSGSGQTSTQSVTLSAGQTSELKVPQGRGTVTVQSDAPLYVYARVQASHIIDALPILTPLAEALTGGGSATPLYVDGLEQSIDAAEGSATSLTMTEIGGQPVTVNVRLYEPGDRIVAISEKNSAIAANGVLRFDDLFASLGLASEPDDVAQRRKERINVLAVVTVVGGNGIVAADAVVTDKRTGARRTVQLLPAGGVAATAQQRLAVVVPPPSERRRAARH